MYYNTCMSNKKQFNFLFFVYFEMIVYVRIFKIGLAYPLQQKPSWTRLLIIKETWIRLYNDPLLIVPTNVGG